jgi:hypothetical protein
MLRKLSILLVLLMAMASQSFATKSVTFTVNMSHQKALGVFYAGRGDSVATFIFSPGGVSAKYWMTTSDTGKAIYTYTLNANDTLAGAALSWKFFMQNGTRSFPNSGYETTANNRGYTVTSAATQTVPTYYFNDDSTSAVPVTRRVQFVADMTALIASGFGAAGDSVNVGVFNGSTPDGTFGSKMVQDFGANTFRVTRTVSLSQTDSISWKFKFYPDSAFANSGYDISNNRYNRMPYVVKATSPDTVYGPYQPANAKKGAQRTINDTLVFTITLNNSPVNRYDGSAIPVSDTSLKVWINGMNDLLGGAGTFVAWDSTAYPTVAGQQQAGKLIPTQRVAGTNTFTTSVVLPKLTAAAQSGIHSFKPGASYRTMPTANPPVTNGPIDNFGGYGFDPFFTVSGNNGITKQSFSVPWGVSANFGLSVKSSNNPAPLKYQLSQNYPNPFNPSTTINFSLPQLESVNLSVFNILGQKVATLVDGKLTAGSYTASFKADKFASGVYFYRLQAGNFVETKKMMLVK